MERIILAEVTEVKSMPNYNLVTLKELKTKNYYTVYTDPNNVPAIRKIFVVQDNYMSKVINEGFAILEWGEIFVAE